MKVKITIEICDVDNVNTILSALEPDNVAYNYPYQSEISCKRNGEILVCEIKSTDILKAKGLLNDLLVNLYVVLKAFDVIKRENL